MSCQIIPAIIVPAAKTVMPRARYASGPISISIADPLRLLKNLFYTPVKDLLTFQADEGSKGTLVALPRSFDTKNGEGTMVTEMVFYVLTALLVVWFAASLLIA
jgi:hypothetical protein